jgi:hypothetical protein
MLLLEFRRQLLHHHHIAVVHGRDGDRGVRVGDTESREEQRGGENGSLWAVLDDSGDDTSPLNDRRSTLSGG